MAKITQEYTLKVTAEGLREIVQEIRALRADMGGLGSGADRASAGLGKAGKSAGQFDRNMKGAANATNNSTKAFSKMSQGMSGSLVPAYATVAANVFALTAAFGALERAADTQILIKASEELSKQTGRSLTSVVKKMKEITNGALSMKEGLTQASLAASAGFDNSTIEKLTQVAKNASVALGRDLTDSMNRVFKGAIKAEPELLDELGIILRLETASRKYAATLNKNAKDLTTFEKQQAVVNEVLAQGTEKFGLLTKIDPNPYTKLAAAMNDVITSALGFVNLGLGPIILAITDNVGLLTGVLLLFANSVATTALPILEKLGITVSQNLAEGFAKFGENLETKGIARSFIEDFEGEFKNAADVFDHTLHSVNLAIEDFGANIPPGITDKINEILYTKDDAISGGQRVDQSVKLVDEALQNLDKSAPDFNKTRSGLIGLRGGLGAYEEGIKSLSPRMTKFRQALENVNDNISKFSNGLKSLKFGAFQGFISGTSEGFFNLVTNTRKFSEELNQLNVRGTIISKTFARLSVSFFAFAGVLGSILNLIPLIAAVTVAVSLLSEGVEWLWKKIRDNNDALEQLSGKFKELKDTVTTANEAARTYSTTMAYLPDTIDNISKKLDIQNNILSETAIQLRELIILQDSVGGFTTATKFVDYFNIGDLDELKDNILPKLISSLKYIGEGNKVLETLTKLGIKEAQISGLQGEEALNLARALQEVYESRQKNIELLNIQQGYLEDNIKLLDDEIAKLYTISTLNSFEKSTIFLAGMISKLKELDTVARNSYFADLSETTKIEFNIDTTQMESLASSFEIAAEEIEKIKTAMKGLQAQRDAMLKTQNELSSADQAQYDLNTAIDEAGKKYRNLGVEISNLTLLLDGLNEMQRQLKDNMTAYTDKALADLAQLSKFYTDITKAQEKYNAIIAKAEFKNTTPEISSSERLKNIKEIADAEANLALQLVAREKELLAATTARITTLQGEKDKSNEIITLTERQLTLQKAVDSSRIQAAKAYQKQLSAIQSVIEDTAKREALGLSVDQSSVDLISQLTPIISQIGGYLGMTNTELDAMISKWVGVAEGNVILAKFNLLSKDSTEQLAAQNAEGYAQNTLEAYRLTHIQQYNGLLSERIDKQQILNKLTNEKLILEAEEKLSRLTDEDQIRDLKEKIKQLQRNNDVQDSTAFNARRSYMDDTIGQQKLLNKLANEEFSISRSSSSIAKEQLAIAQRIAKERRKLSGDVFDEAELKKLKKELERGLVLKVRLELREDAKSFDQFGKLNDILDEMHDRFKVLTNPVDKVVAGFVALGKVGKEMGNTQVEAFGSIGNAIDKYKEEHKKAGFDGNKIMEAQVGLIGDVAGGMAQMFKEGTAGAQAFGAVQASMAVIDGVKAIIVAGTSNPFPLNILAMAATAAQVAAQLQTIGKSVNGVSGGKVSGQAEVDAYKDSFGAQGVQGVDLQTNSLVDSIDSLIEIDTKLFSANRNLQVALVELKKSFEAIGSTLFKAGGNFDAGNILDIFGVSFGESISTGLFGFGGKSRSNSLVAAGIQLGAEIEFTTGTIMGSITDAQLVLAQQITQTKTKWYGKSRTRTWIEEIFKELPEDVASHLSSAMRATTTFLTESFISLSDMVDANLETIFKSAASVTIDPKVLNLFEKDAEEQGRTVAAFFSHMSNEIIASTFPWLEQFTRANEELTDTLIRVVGEVSQLSDTFSTIKFDYTSVVPQSIKQFTGTSQTDAQLMESVSNFFDPVGTALIEGIQAGIDEYNAELESLTIQQNMLFTDSGRRAGWWARVLISQRISEIELAIEAELANLADAEANFYGGYSSIEAYVESLKVEMLVAWNEAFMEKFKNVDDFQSIFEKFSRSIFTESELAAIAIQNAEDTLSNGFTTLTTQLDSMGLGNLTDMFAEGITSKSLKAFYDFGVANDLFSGKFNETTGEMDYAGAHLFATLIQLGAAYTEQEDLINEVQNKIDDYNKGIQRQIDLFGLSGKELDLLQLSFDFADEIEAAKAAGGDIAKVETLFGLKRLEIIKNYNQEIVNLLTEGMNSIADASLDVVKSFAGWDEVTYQVIKIDRLQKLLNQGLNLTGITADFTAFTNIFDNISGVQDFTDSFGEYFNISEQIPGTIEEQIDTVEQLKSAIIDRYNAEEKALDNLRGIISDIGNFLDSLKIGDLSPATNPERLAEAQRQFNKNLVDANSEDPEIRDAAQQALISSGQTLLEMGSEFFGMSDRYTRDIYNPVTEALSQFALESTIKLSAGELKITQLQQDTLTQLGVLDDILIELQAQNTAAVTSEIDIFAASLGTGIADAISTQLAELDFTSMFNYVFSDLNSFSTGSPEIQYDQIAKIHKGEMIIPAAAASDVRLGDSVITNINNANNNYSTETTSLNSEEIVAAIRVLTEVLAMSQEDLLEQGQEVVRTLKNTKQLTPISTTKGII